MEDFDGKKTHATYKSFKLAGESELYKLHLGAFLGGPAGKTQTILSFSFLNFSFVAFVIIDGCPAC